MTQGLVRVLWLMNHATLRRFEVGQLRELGINEIYCPKSFPYDEGNLSATIDHSLDASLSIPVEDLRILNQQNWYESPSEDAWRIANRFFDIAIIGFFPRQIASCVAHFDGALVLRAFGLAKEHSYTRILTSELGSFFQERLRRLGDRLWFGAGYEHLKDVEGDLLRRRNCFLPVGLVESSAHEPWRGTDKRVFFVCPRIETSPYFKRIYETFKNDFEGFDYVIGGAQPIRVNDPSVLGFVTNEEHARNMREIRVMFYHSAEPNHVHYHPFEAIRAGMPLVFMAGGMLDRFGGEGQPGRARTINEARAKIERILRDDRGLIAEIRGAQTRMLEPLRPANCIQAWRVGVRRIMKGLETAKVTALADPKRKHRVAVIVPVTYRGGTLRAAKLLARALELGSARANQPAEVVFAHLDDRECYPDDEFEDLPPSIKRRRYSWRKIDLDAAGRAMAYAGLDLPATTPEAYIAPDDGINQFMDCDLWIFISDRLSYPVLPVRPYVLMVFDYLQRYESFLPEGANRSFIGAAQSAERVLVTTEFTRQDAIQYAGVHENPASKGHRVVKVPMLATTFASRKPLVQATQESPRYFVWTTNLSLHKNHENAFKALRNYYEKYDGQLNCHVTGVETSQLLTSDLSHIKPLREIRKQSRLLRAHLRVLGELPDRTYQAELAGSEFLWHAGRVDNGAFSVVEAAHLGVPALSSDYPAMREIDARYGLNLSWMNSHDPDNMARELKRLETEAGSLRARLPSAARLATPSFEQAADIYWKVVRECL